MLEDARFVVPPAEPGGPVGGLRWLRSSVSRFSNGPEHERRRAIGQVEIDGLDPRRLRDEAARWTTRVVERPGGEPFDAMALLARRVPVGVLCAGLGVAGGDPDNAVDDVPAVGAAWDPEPTPSRGRGLTVPPGGSRGRSTAGRTKPPPTGSGWWYRRATRPLG